MAARGARLITKETVLIFVGISIPALTILVLALLSINPRDSATTGE